MGNSLQKGASNATGIIIIIVLAAIMLFTYDGPSLKERASKDRVVGGSTLTSGGRAVSEPNRSNTTTLRGAEVSIGTGNASRSYQSYEEYITLDNKSEDSLNITGWQLRNGKDERSYYSNGSMLQRFSADVALVPQASLFLSPSGTQVLQDVILEEDERAIITTGSVGARAPYTITSFKENICSGYLENMPEYAFTPALSRSCPRPSKVAGLENLEPACRTFVSRLSSCETPDFTEKDRQGEPCNNCVNGTKLSSSCVSYVREHFSYQGCLAYHRNDPDFSLRTWRIFLGRGWEMWAEEYETIELFDRFGQLINFRNY